MTQTFRMTRTMRLGTALLKALLRAGVPLGPLVLLSVRGRKSGKISTTPVALVQHGNERWLVAAFGEVNWVQNLRAAGTAHLIRGRRTEAVECGDGMYSKSGGHSGVCSYHGGYWRTLHSH